MNYIGFTKSPSAHSSAGIAQSGGLTDRFFPYSGKRLFTALILAGYLLVSCVSPSPSLEKTPEPQEPGYRFSHITEILYGCLPDRTELITFNGTMTTDINVSYLCGSTLVEIAQSVDSTVFFDERKDLHYMLLMKEPFSQDG